MKKRVVITGMGFVTQCGYKKEDLWKKIEKGYDIPGYYSKIDDKKTTSKCAFVIDDNFNPNDFINNRATKRFSDFSKILCCAAQFALKDAVLNSENDDFIPERIGSIVNTVHGPMKVTFDYLDDLFNIGPSASRPFLFQQTVNNVACGQVAINNKLKGVSSTLIGTSSLKCAVDLLEKGTADAIVVMGNEELHPYIYKAYDNTKMLSKAKNECEKAVPFSEYADGMVLGEGAGALVLETLENAQKRNVHIYAELINESVVTDERFVKRFDEFSVEESSGFMRAMSNVLQKSEIESDKIGFVSLASNACKEVDDTEKKAIKNLFGDNKALGFVAHKAFLGETLGASEVLAVIVALMCLENDSVPGLAYNEDKFSTKNTDYCIVNSMFTGGNVNSALLRKYRRD